jgi:hypothetical protein
MRKPQSRNLQTRSKVNLYERRGCEYILEQSDCSSGTMLQKKANFKKV